MGEQCPGRRAESLGGTEKSQQCRKYFLQYSTFAPEKTEIRKWGRQTCFLPRAPSNLGTPLDRTYADWVHTIVHPMHRSLTAVFWKVEGCYTP